MKKKFFFRWVVLFSHPADFTPVCTTELGRMAVHDHEFKKRGVKIIGHSCDKLQSHVDWVNVSILCAGFTLYVQTCSQIEVSGVT